MDLYQHDSEYRYWLDRLDQVAQNRLGQSIIAKLQGHSNSYVEERAFSRTLYTHPALFMVQFALARSLMASGAEPSGVFGVSLGEFVAAAVAGVAAPELLFEEVIHQAKSLEVSCPSGGMLAILCPPDIYYDTSLIHENSSLVGINYSEHFVVSGDISSVRMIAEYLRRKDIACHNLAVSHGFHSPVIDDAEPYSVGFRANMVSDMTYSAPTLPLFSCSKGGDISDVSRAHFWQAIREPIRFTETLYKIEKKSENTFYLDLGPSGTLSGFVKQNLKKKSASIWRSILSPYGHDHKKLLEIKEKIASVVG